MTLATFLALLSLVALGYVIGRVHEGARAGGTVDLQVELGLRDPLDPR